MSIQSNLNQLLTIGSAGLYAGQSKSKTDLSSQENKLYEFGKTEAGNLKGDYKKQFEQDQKERMFLIEKNKAEHGDSILALKKEKKFVRKKYREAVDENWDLLGDQKNEEVINNIMKEEELKAQQRLSEKQANEAEQRKQLEIRKKWMQGVREEYGKR